MRPVRVWAGQVGVSFDQKRLVFSLFMGLEREGELGVSEKQAEGVRPARSAFPALVQPTNSRGFSLWSMWWVSIPGKRSEVEQPSVVGSPSTEFGGCFRKIEHLPVASTQRGTRWGRTQINQTWSAA